MKILTRKEYLQRHTAKHLRELKAIGYTADKLKPLRLIEGQASRAAERYCNGKISERQYDNIENLLSDRVASLFGGKLPRGFFINGDPRGYALKIDNNKYQNSDNPVSYTDWGGYMILAPSEYI